jgi:hypothetical protein
MGWMVGGSQAKEADSQSNSADPQNLCFDSQGQERKAYDRETFEQPLSQADILLHGYRPGALDRLGYDPAARCN